MGIFQPAMLVDDRPGEISVIAGGRLDLWLLGCVLLPCAPFAAMIITSRCSQETQVAKGSNNFGPLKLGDEGGNFTTDSPHCFF